jgi:polyhydroxyalkanoate synthase
MTDGRPEPARSAWRRAPVSPGVRLAAALAARPLTVARRGAGLAAELARIGLGRSRVAPPRDDPRYADPVWRENPVLRRAVQVHVAARTAARGLVRDAGLAPADDALVGAVVDAVAEVLAPGNFPLRADVWRTVTAAPDEPDATETAAPPRVAGGRLEIGSDVAATPGAVVLRTPVFELLQYLPQTENVREVPLVVVPPVMGRYYLADLAPGRSIVEHLVHGGQQVFAISWRNPEAGDSGWDLDTYGQAVLDAMDAAEHIARTPRTSLMAFGSGGVVSAMLLGHLAAIGVQERVASVTFAATVLDREGARAEPAAARTVADVLGWPYRLRSYLAGEPPASHALFRDADAIRVPEGLHRELADVLVRRALAVPGAASLLGTPVDLAKVDRDCYVVAGAGDRTAAWPDVYRATRLLGGACRFVLADGGQLASIISPPGEADTSFRTAAPPVGAAAPDCPPRDWVALATAEHGSWWDDHLAWLAGRTGLEHDAPPELGGRGMHALAPAPGDYVLEQ